MCDRLFSAGEAVDPTYMNLRDLKNEWNEAAREFAESLWDRFRRFADPHFLGLRSAAISMHASGRCI
jgi:hypothetical protein